MKIAYALVAIIGIIGLISTFLLAGSVETNYGKSTKRNVTNLTAIYAVLFIILLAGAVWYAVYKF